MQTKYRLDLQLFADGAPAGDGGGEAAGASAADAGQSFESRLEQLGVPKSKIRKGAYKGSKAAQPASTPAAETAKETQEPEAEGGAADRKPWEQIKADYKTEYDAEVQGIVKGRIKNSQTQIQELSARAEKIAPMLEFLAHRYGLDPENLDYDQLMDKFRGDNSLSSERALEMGTTDEVAHRVEMTEIEEQRRARQQKLQQAFDAQQQALRTRFDELQAQAQELAKKIPGFDLSAEMGNPAFLELTKPGSPVTVEMAYYALHPEFRQAEAESVAKRATEAVASSVRAGATRPQEAGTQAAASISTVPYSQMSKEDREAWKQRARAAAARGEHLKFGR